MLAVEIPIISPFAVFTFRRESLKKLLSGLPRKMVFSANGDSVFTYEKDMQEIG